MIQKLVDFQQKKLIFCTVIYNLNWPNYSSNYLYALFRLFSPCRIQGIALIQLLHLLMLFIALTVIFVTWPNLWKLSLSLSAGQVSWERSAKYKISSEETAEINGWFLFILISKVVTAICVLYGRFRQNVVLLFFE